MGINTLMWQLDQGVTGLFAQWNGYSTGIVTVLVLLITFQILSRTDPDTHPMLLARQSAPSQVRQEGESAVYRAFATPHGTPLNSGLNVSDPGQAKWSKGRDGDLRDVWRQVLAGTSAAGGLTGKGKILTVMGKEKVVESSLEGVTRQIDLVGRHILNQGGNRVAIYLPNSVECMASLFACAFHGLTPILLPFNQPNDVVISMLRRSAADTVITAPGSFPFDATVKSYPALRNLIWVVDDGAAHLDWDEVPEGTGSSVNVATWKDMMSDAPTGSMTELPPFKDQPEARDLTMFWVSEPGTLPEMVRFTPSTITSAISGQLFAVPQTARMGPADLFLPADSLANSYTLILTLTALYSNASVAFNSVAGESTDLDMATMGVAPTVIIATPSALLATHESCMQSTTSSLITSRIHTLQTRSLSRDGAMPTASLLSSINAAFRPASSRTPGKLRLIYTADRAGSSSTPPLSSAVLADLRILTGARILYALSAARVAGAIAQTGLYDYRVQAGERSHFGPPLTSVEVLMRDSGSMKTTDDNIEGEMVARGPAVAGLEASLGIMGKIGFDNTISYA